MNHHLPCYIEIDSQAKITALSEAQVKSEDHDLKPDMFLYLSAFWN